MQTNGVINNVGITTVNNNLTKVDKSDGLSAIPIEPDLVIKWDDKLMNVALK
jgi:hypothetical protein